MSMSVNQRVFDRRQLIRGASGLCGSIMLGSVPVFADSVAAAAGSEAISLVHGGQASAVVVHADNASSRIRSIAAEFVDQISQSTGTRLTVVAEFDLPSVDAALNRVYLGFAGPGSWPGATDRAAALDDSGFLLASQGNTVTVLGGSDVGVRNGCYEILERYLNVRFIMPDPHAHRPLQSELTVAAGLHSDEPAFHMRAISPYRWLDWSTPPTDVKKWGNVIRSYWDLQFLHSLHALVPISTYGTPGLPTFNESLWPLNAKGDPVMPAPGSKNWQPRFRADDLPAIVAARALTYYAASRNTISLGVNDVGASGYSRDEIDYSNVNIGGYFSASEAYYGFVNRVAEIVAAKRPNIRIGLLAYREVMEPPSFDLHPNVVPMLCWDRGGWLWPERRRMDQELTLRWLSRCPNLGWYDYRYGAWYMAPRTDYTVIAEAYRWAQDVGVTHIYAEHHPNWSEPAKAWMFSQLLWNPGQSPDRLQAEFARCAVGHRAAPHLLAYERQWEQIWRDKIAPTDGFRYNSHKAFMFYDQVDYLAAIDDDDVRAARQSMNRVLAGTQTDDEAARAKVFNDIFTYQEASILSYPHPAADVQTSKDAHRLIDHIEQTLDRNIELAVERRGLVANLAKNPLYGTVLRPSLAGTGRDWSGFNPHPLWPLGDYLRQHEPQGGAVSGRIARLAQGAHSVHLRRFARLVQSIAAGQATNLFQNPSFEGDTIRPWGITVDGVPYEPIRQDSNTSVDGGRSLRIPLGIGDSYIQQNVPVQAGGVLRTAFQYRALASASAASQVFLRFSARIYDTTARQIAAFSGTYRNASDAVTDWKSHSMSVDLPDKAANVTIFVAILLNPTRDGALYIDNAECKFVALPALE